MSDDVQTSATIASLRASLEAAAEREESLQAQMKYVRQALDDRNAYAERLLAENVRLSNEAAEARSEVSAIGTRLSMEQEDHAATRKELDAVVILLDGQRVLCKEAESRAESLSHSIITACTGSGCLNAHELRVALNTARERAGVLEREVRAWRDAVNTLDMISEHPDHQHCISGEWDDGRKCDDCKLWSDAVRCRRETYRTNALDAAKFGGAT